jgi:hypothetical protein
MYIYWASALSTKYRAHSILTQVTVQSYASDQTNEALSLWIRRKAPRFAICFSDEKEFNHLTIRLQHRRTRGGVVHSDAHRDDPPVHLMCVQGTTASVKQLASGTTK